MTQKYRRQIIIGLAFLIIFPVYFSFFFQSGMVLNETFVPKTMEDGRAMFKGEDVTIRVQRSEKTGSVILLKPDWLKTYIVMVGDNKEYYKDIVIYENDVEIFRGLYDSKGSSNFKVFEKDGTPYLGDTNIVVNGEKEPIDSLSIPALVRIFEEDFDIRGNVAPMLFAVIILILWAIDICYPRALFWFQHFLSVENPEPSDFYLTTQRISWVVIPILAVIMMIYSLV